MMQGALLQLVRVALLPQFINRVSMEGKGERISTTDLYAAGITIIEIQTPEGGMYPIILGTM